MVSAVEARALGHRYLGSAAPALDAVSFSVRPGEVFGVLGPNGGGKTTLFRILATALRPSSGGASVMGRDLASERDEVRRRIGVVFQSPSLDKRLSVRENLGHQGRLYGLGSAELAERSRALLERFGLADRAGERVSTLSGGLARRAELAKGLLHKPSVLILDEPSTGLDPGARRDLWDLLKELSAKDGAAVLVTTHWMEEAERCDRLAILSAGRVVAEGSPSALKQELGGDVVSFVSRRPEELRSALRERLGVEAAVVDGAVRVERAGAALLARAAQELGPMFESATVGRPTLEDVFIRRTGHRFWREP